MSIQEVYEKHKHLDQVLSDPQFCEGSAMAFVARDLWLAVKEAAQQSAQPTPENGRDLPAKSNDSEGSAPAKSG